MKRRGGTRERGRKGKRDRGKKGERRRGNIGGGRGRSRRGECGPVASAPRSSNSIEAAIDTCRAIHT